MQIVDTALANVEKARAYQFDDVLLVRACGEKPTGCHIVTLEQSLLDVEPPAFIARLSTDPRVRCRPEPVAFEEQRAFRLGSLRPRISIHHGGGELLVDVENLTPEAEADNLAAAPEGRARTSIFNIDREPQEAIGLSRTYDLGEAIHDAIKQLPPQGAGIPDWLSTYTVISISAEIGGIAGFDHLKVRVVG